MPVEEHRSLILEGKVTETFDGVARSAFADELCGCSRERSRIVGEGAGQRAQEGEGYSAQLRSL